MRDKKGITLIALIITIIVLLILAGISIATLTGQNGILTKAKEEQKVTTEGEEKEQITIAYNVAKTEKIQNSDTSNPVAKDLQLELDKQKVKATAEDKTNKIEVTFEETGNKYTIDVEKGKIDMAKEEILFKVPTGPGYGYETVTFYVQEGTIWSEFLATDPNVNGNWMGADPDFYGIHSGDYKGEVCVYIQRFERPDYNYCAYFLTLNRRNCKNYRSYRIRSNL